VAIPLRLKKNPCKYYAAKTIKIASGHDFFSLVELRACLKATLFVEMTIYWGLYSYLSLAFQFV